MIRSAIETGPSTEPVSLVEFKDHLRITTNDEDTYLSAILTAARQAAENWTGKKFINTTMEGYLTDIPSGDSFIVVPGPVSSITEIQYYDTQNSGTVWNSANYSLDTYSSPCRVYRNYGVSWPSATRTWNPIYIKWIAGYGSTPDSVPNEICHAIREIASAWWDARMPSEQANAKAISEGPKAKLWPYRTLYFGAME